MRQISFLYLKEKSLLFGEIYKPVARVSFWSERYRSWVRFQMLVDTGADYSILPRFAAVLLGFELKKLKQVQSFGTAGEHKLFFQNKIKTKLGPFTREIPVAFSSSSKTPPLLGRQDFLETFETVFSKKKQLTFRS